MRHIQTDILVIGGGATGTGILRDLSMRGFKCLLVERRDLAYGTTGRYHGLLHSGGRYAVKDPPAARECMQENRILRQIMPQCLEDTGGFFVLTAHDDPAYVPSFLKGCDKAGIPAEEIEVEQMMKQEPLLDPTIKRCFRLPDASADSFLAADLNLASARQHGASLLTYHEVKTLITDSSARQSASMVTGAVCHDLVKDEEVEITASMVVNACGPWAGKIASLAGINLLMLPGKGSMVAVNHRVVNTVINRCKMPADGDILVPAHSVAVMGTTDIRVADPDHYAIEPWEIRLMRDEGEKIIPRFKELRILRAWAGVRPLVKEGSQVPDRDVSRSFTLLDHAERDGTQGLLTIAGGKWTTYRKMAEATVDKICEKLNVTRPCRTHQESLPAPNEAESRRNYLGARLEKIEQEATYGQLVCECELVTREEVERSIIESDAQTLDDIRRDVRLGMGPCQSAFCALRAAGILHSLRHPPVAETNVSLRDFLQERWKGDLPILWGQQLRQERFNELVYIDVLNTPALPGEKSSRLSSERYSTPPNETRLTGTLNPPANENRDDHKENLPVDILVIGAGLSGLVTAWRAGSAGKKVKLITKGWGADYWSSGCIDLMGYLPPDFSLRIQSPIEEIGQFIHSHPSHPYALAGLDRLFNAVNAFIELSQLSGTSYSGSLESNFLLPTALGTLRPTCLAPTSMLAGEIRQATPMLIVGFDQYLDFYPTLISDNLDAQGMLAQGISLDLGSLRSRKFVSGIVLARLFDSPEFRSEVVNALKPRLGKAGRVGFPAVIGLDNSAEALNDLQFSLGVPVFEIPGLPPSIADIRLHNLLVSSIQNQGGQVFNGMNVIRAVVDSGMVTSVISEAASRQISHPARTFVLATGGILGGGITIHENGYAQELIFNINLDIPDTRAHWFHDQFLLPQSHPIHSIGINADHHFHPIDSAGRVILQNLYTTGSMLGNCDPIRERSLEGIALVTGYVCGELLSADGSQ